MYEVTEITSIQEIRKLFPNGIADRNNWILLSTGGIHGSTETLDDLEYILRGEVPENPPMSNGKWFITVFIVFPKYCAICYGEIAIGLEDVQYLRKLVRSTLENIVKSQGGNI